jgi:hypothetical protein
VLRGLLREEKRRREGGVQENGKGEGGWMW